MANSNALPPSNSDHRRVAAGQFERANQVVATGNYDYGIRLLMSCCKLEPGNLIYRQALRRAEKTKFSNNLRGSWHARWSTWTGKARVKALVGARDYLKVLEHGERVLMRNPWDVGVQMDMATAADGLGLLDVAVWCLEQARQKTARDAALNRALARLYEKRGNFLQAMALWQMVLADYPTDLEAQHKMKDLAAHDTIARGRYEPGAGGAEAVAAALRPGQAPPEPEEEEASTPLPAPTARASADGSGKLPKGAPVKGNIGSSADHRVAREAAMIRTKLEADPTNLNCYLQLAALYRRVGLLEQARGILNEGLGPTGNAFELALELADLDIEPFRQNLLVTEDKLRDNPDDEDLRRIRLRLRKEVNTRELDFFRQKAERFPTELGLRFEVGVRLLRAGQHDEAIQMLQASRSDPRFRWQSMLWLGHCFKARNNWRLAQRNFEDALQNLPVGESAARKDLLFLLAQGFADEGDLTRAIDMGHELANLDFSFRDIGRLLDEWQNKQKQSRVSH
jgi:tetratricopeptide (TPR) repeat protein